MKPLNRNLLLLLSLLSAGALTFRVRGMTSAELKSLMEQKAELTVVDIRPRSAFSRGHIPGAINVPARVVARKNLPPLGRVVVCGDGMGGEDVALAVEQLNAKPGIRAEALEGGLAAWERAKGMTTQPPGLHEEAVNQVSFQRVEEMRKRGEPMVLVDLRKPSAGSLSRQSVGENARVSLSEKFPGARVVNSPFEVAGVPGSGRLSRQADKPLPLMVLIDDGDGRAVEMARTLRANGVRRVVVLAGGELILERDGAPGLKRMGMGSDELEKNDADE